jgi:pimeloyl-ACP methyl ester carboxylesterase
MVRLPVRMRRARATPFSVSLVNTAPLKPWAQDDRLFKNLAPILAKDFHVVCPNYRGHDAKQTLHGDFTAEDLVDDVEAFIKAKDLSNVHFVSTSHGCWVNIGLCERMKINRTVVIDWLMQPHDGFFQQLKDGQDPDRYKIGRQSFFDEGRTVLLVDQAASLALSVADRAYVLQSGKITHSGTADEIAQDPALIRAYLGAHGDGSALLHEPNA